MLLKKIETAKTIKLTYIYHMLRQLQEVLSRNLITIKSKTSTIFREDKIELETTSRQCRRR